MWGEHYLAEKNAWDESFTAQESWAQNRPTLGSGKFNLPKSFDPSDELRWLKINNHRI